MVTEQVSLQDPLSTFVDNACVSLSTQKSHAAVIQVLLQTNRFREDLPQYNPSLAVPLPYPTRDSLEVNRCAAYLCERMFKPGYQYKKAGWAAAGFDDTLLRWKMKLEVANGHEKEVQPRVQA